MNSKILFLTTALITGFAIAPAYAGFEWNPPPVRAAKAPASAQTPSNMPSDVGGPLTPMPGESLMPAKVEPVTEADIMDNGTPVPPVTSVSTQPGMRSIGNEPQNLTGQNIDENALPVPGEMASAPAPESNAVVEGFGKDIPLAVALRQIVPSSYNVNYDAGVDQGKPVTWNGGKAWNEVASEMLARRKLHATASGNMITISEGVGADLLPVYAAAPAPAPVIADAASPSGKPTIDMNLQKRWAAQPGQGLRETLQNWSGQANVELAWQSDKDLPINNAFSYDGTFDQAVDALLSSYTGDANEPHGKLYPNLPEGPSVLVIGSN